MDVHVAPEKSWISAYADTRHPRGGMSSTPPGRRVDNESEISLEQKLRPRGLAEWTAVLAAAGLGVSVPLHLFDATVLFTYHPSAMALSFGAIMPLGVYVALKTRALGAGPLRLRAMWTHAALQTFAAALAFGGLVAIYLNKSVLGKPHFATTHAALGAAAAALTALSMLLGALNFNRLGLLQHVPAKHRAAVKSAHRKCGASAVLAGAACVATAINHPAVAAAAGPASGAAWVLLLAAGFAGLARVAAGAGESGRERDFRSGGSAPSAVEMGKRAAA